MIEDWAARLKAVPFPQAATVLLQRVEIAVHAREIDHAFVHGRRRHNRADGDESVEVDVHVFEVAEEGSKGLLVESAVGIQNFHGIFLGGFGLPLPGKLAWPLTKTKALTAALRALRHPKNYH